MRALEEVALSYDQKAEEAAKTTILQSKLDDAELKSDKLSNVIILHIFLLVLKIISSNITTKCTIAQIVPSSLNVLFPLTVIKKSFIDVFFRYLLPKMQ